MVASTAVELISGYGLGDRRRIAPGAVRRAAAEQALRAKFRFHDGAHGVFHARVVRRTVGLEQNLAIPLQAQSIGNSLIATEQTHELRG